MHPAPLLPKPFPAVFNILIVGQSGRLGYEALVFAASLRANSPGFSGRLIVAEPQPGPLWPEDPRLPPHLREALAALGAEVTPFASRHFGATYPHGNKIEGLAALPPDRPFVFFDTDTLILGDIAGVPFDFARPAASMRRINTWPAEDIYWPGYTATWKSLYDRFGLEFQSSLDLAQPDEYWRRYLYFNAGWFFGDDPVRFGALFAAWATSIRDDPPEAIRLQSLKPWLDQVTLPLVIHALGGGRPPATLAGLDDDVTCHYRTLPLLYARESDAAVAALEAACAPNPIKKILKEHAPIHRMVYRGGSAKVRALFDRDDLPPREGQIRNRIRQAGYWMR